MTELSKIHPFLIRTTTYAIPNLTSYKICITWLLYASWSLSCHGYGFLLRVTVESPIILASNYRDAENPTSLLGHIYWRSRRKNEFIGARLLRNFPWEKQPLVLMRLCLWICLDAKCLLRFSHGLFILLMHFVQNGLRNKFQINQFDNKTARCYKVNKTNRTHSAVRGTGVKIRWTSFSLRPWVIPKKLQKLTPIHCITSIT